jgi:hypothetical protein
LAFALAFALALALALALTLPVATPALAGPTTLRLCRNDSLRLRGFEPPVSWQPAPQANYPRVVCAYTHPDGGRLTLSAQKVAPGTAAESLAQGARAGLEKQGFSDVRISVDHSESAPRARLDAHLEGGRRFLRQLYLVDGGLGYVVTLVAGSITEPEMTRDFDWALRTLSIGSEAPKVDPDGGVPR